MVRRARRTAAGVARGGPENRRRRFRGRSDRMEATAAPLTLDGTSCLTSIRDSVNRAVSGRHPLLPAPASGVGTDSPTARA